MRRSIALITGSLLAALSLALAESPARAVDWQGAGRDMKSQSYKDLPGVKPQASLKDEDRYRCHTETRDIRRRYDEIFRSGGMPTLVYVCERDGIESSGTEVPLRGHYQPVR